MLIIGICGASGSGKSTMAKALCQRVEKMMKNGTIERL